GGAAIAPSVANALRINPLSGEPELKVYRPSVVCGAPYFSDYMMSGRSGIYDFADDSGMRFVGGVKTRCTTPQVVALGLIMISDETGHCSCNLPFRTTLALAPAERRLNEDWAMFHDRTPDTQLRRAAINLGAPGDRRDDQGTLWLGFPRPPADKGMGNSLAAGKQYTVANPGDWLRFTPPAMQVPLEIETYGGPLAYHPEEDVYTAYGWSSSWGANRKGLPFGPNRVNPDRVIVQGTDRPWIYASSYRGIRKATLKLNFIKPVASVACDKPPALDAALAGPAWAGEPQIALPFTGTKVYLRHDAANLYLAARRPSVVNRLGAVSPWSKSTKGDDAAVWLDDSIEFFLSDAKGKGVVHLGVSASGARYDALASGGDLEDKAWGGPWKSAVVADEKGLAFELAIPWSTLAGAGLDRDQMTINLLINQRDVTGEANKYPGNLGRNFSEAERASEAMVSLGIRGRSRCEHFAPMGLGTAPTLPPRSFAVRLHFAELDDVKPGQRVFDVKIQGQTVLRNFDVLKEAGGREKAVVKEFSHIQAGDTMAVEFVPVVTIAPVGTMPAEPTPMSGPILSGLEVEEENAAGAASPRP
ncbi:MAG: malectin domain-containing carbohydrate-binding protein, partial [Planctomycetota bacterium]|nr:malectin domain-containing carbohydrate-binding protein [Planctomycetota bacterium]